MTESNVTLHNLKPSSILTKSVFLTCIGIALLSAFHVTLVVLWSMKILDRLHFDLSQLGRISQLLTVALQTGSVATLAVLAYATQTVAADKFIRRSKQFIMLSVIRCPDVVDSVDQTVQGEVTIGLGSGLFMHYLQSCTILLHRFPVLGGL